MKYSEARATSGNGFRHLLIASAAGKIADQITNARTTLPWLLSQIGAPAYFLGLLVPLRESLSMLPQLFLSPMINRYSRRRGLWITAALIQAASLLATPLCLWMPTPTIGGLWVILMLIVFSLARCFCSITFKDLNGKMVSSTRRGRLTGYATGISGVAVIGTGFILLTTAATTLNTTVILLLFSVSAALWCLGALQMAALPEHDGETDDHDGILAGILRNYRLLGSEAGLRMLVLSRAFLLCPILAAPYLVALADQDSSAALLGGLILINGISSALCAPLWGHLADRSSRLCMLGGGLLASLALAVAATSVFTSAAGMPEQWLLLGCYTLLIVGHAGIRTGRKTYTTNIAEGSMRTRYVSVSNSLIGVVLLVVGALGSLIATLSVPLLVGLLAGGGLIGSLISLGMPRAAEENRTP